jgi:hypothetical protein
MTVNRWQAADERRNELVVEFKRGKVIEMGPSVDDYDPERLRQIMDQVVADSAEVLKRLALGPQDDDFFEEDQPIEEVSTAWDAAEKHLTEPPADGAGWCAPSP